MGSKLTSTRKWFAALHTPLCLFSRMSEQVLVQISSLVKWLVTLCTIVQFLSSVSYHMGSKLTSTRKWFAALHTPLCLFSRISELVVLQTSGLIKCLIALITFIKVRSTAVGCHMVHKGCAVCLWTQVTRICLCHRKGLNQAQRVVNMYWRYNVCIKIVFSLHFPFQSWKEDNQANK